jgi:glycosyltransferase involved in cell wall biosynthesis
MQKEIGLEPYVITSVIQKPLTDGEIYEIINDIPYYRTYIFDKNSKDLVPKKSIFLRIKKSFRMYYFLNKLKEVASNLKPDIIHAHAIFFCGIPSYLVSKKLKIPFIYEYRSNWEDNVYSEGGFKNWQYKLVKHFENTTFKLADKIICINENLKNDVINRGVNPSKISVVPNAVDTRKFHPIPKNIDIIKKYNLENKFIIGFIGSLIKIEGIEYLIKSAKNLENMENIKFIIVGDGNDSQKLKKFSEELNIKNIIFTGRVPYDDVLNYYSVIDVFCLPRINSKTANEVTPLKPLEAMACEKIVLASNLKAINEFIIDENNGILFEPENIDELTYKIKNIIDNFDKYKNIGKNAREYVVKNRDWLNNVRLYKSIYDSLLEIKK